MNIHTRTLTVFSLALILALAVTLLTPVPPAYALTFSVNSLNDLNDGACNAAHCSLREAIIATISAPSNDSIIFSVSGTIFLSSTLPGISPNNVLIIDGSNTITIDGGSRVRVISNSGNLTLRNLTITNGAVFDDFGGGVLNKGRLLIENSTFSNNTASTLNATAGGGAIYNGGSLTINDGYFNFNKAINTGRGIAEGGAIYSNGEYTEVKIDENTILKRNQAAHHGGAIYNALGHLTIKNSKLEDNSSAKGGGGGIYDRNGASMNIINTTLKGNSAEFGGGIFSSAYLTEIHGSTFESNSANNTDGGGIYIHSSSTLDISNSTLKSNVAQNGGGVFLLGGAGFINVTLSENRATISGGGVHARSNLKLYNTIIADSVSGGDCTLGSGGFMTGISYNNLIEGTASNACGLDDGTNGNIIGSDPDLRLFVGSPAYYTLGNNSPAIDAGNDTICVASPVNNTSQNGVTRPQGAHCDIGAYEKQ